MLVLQGRYFLRFKGQGSWKLSRVMGFDRWCANTNWYTCYCLYVALALLVLIINSYVAILYFPSYSCTVKRKEYFMLMSSSNEPTMPTIC